LHFPEQHDDATLHELPSLRQALVPQVEVEGLQ
jgi:hypothetical protein